MKLFLAHLVLLNVAVTIGKCEASNWKKYKELHNKDYKEKLDGGKNDNIRKAIYLQRDGEIQKHNSGNHSFKVGHNVFSDMSNKELAVRLGTTLPPSPRVQNSKTVILQGRRRLPDSLDYRNSYCLPPLKSQGSCGSCWAFTAITPLEFDRCRKSKSLSILSEQQLIDCDTGSTNHGCSGGWYTVAWVYLQAVNGSTEQFRYPYVGSQSSCKFSPDSKSMIGAKVSLYNYVEAMNATAMQEALVEYGPLATAMTVVGSFYYYTSGVYDDEACDNLPVNHGVVLVGWGTYNNTIENWVVRNTWGPNWAINGYFLIKRGVNKCSIEKYPAFVVSV